MGQTPGDEKPNEPSLELPSLSLPGLGRRKRSRKRSAPEQQPGTPEAAPAEVQEAPRRRAVKERPAPPARRERSTPVVPGPVAAVLTGLLVGGAGAGATYGAMAGCEAVRGVSTCGGAPGFFVLVAIVVVMVLLGSLLLKAFRVRDTTGTSFLAVGLVTVVVMLTLLDVVYTVWMFAVVPVLSALAYLLAGWVTTRFDEEPTDIRR